MCRLSPVFRVSRRGKKPVAGALQQTRRLSSLSSLARGDERWDRNWLELHAVPCRLIEGPLRTKYLMVEEDEEDNEEDRP